MNNGQYGNVEQEFWMLASRIPGGIIQCAVDEPLTICQISEGFLSLFGYTREEIDQLFQNSLLAMICTEDREQVCQQTGFGGLNNKTCELEYRVKRRDGCYLWVSDRRKLIQEPDGKNYYYCILLDIDQSKRAYHDLYLSLERHRIIMDQTNEIIFELDFEKDIATFSSTWEKKFGYQPITTNFSKKIHKNCHVHPEDLPAFFKFLHNYNDADPYVEGEFRIFQKSGQYIWCRIRATMQHESTGEPIKAVGVITDIDKERNKAQQLLEYAQRDPLTGLYNKMTAQNLVEDYLAKCNQKEICALLILDVDNFKQVNDTQGHPFGDEVLVNAAEKIKGLFRKSDILGRIGGDEFLIFMKGIPDEAFAGLRAQSLVDMFCNIATLGQENLLLSCSVGVAISPQDGTDFLQLFKNADHALYQAKKRGKNNHYIYQQHKDIQVLL